MSFKERAEMLEKGPFNLVNLIFVRKYSGFPIMLLISSQVFHGVESDWMEEEMADDPEFKRDVLEQRIKKIIKDEVRDEFVLLLWEFPGCFIHFPKNNAETKCVYGPESKTQLTRIISEEVGGVRILKLFVA